jgi:hypothetical protein
MPERLFSLESERVSFELDIGNYSVKRGLWKADEACNQAAVQNAFT